MYGPPSGKDAYGLVIQVVRTILTGRYSIEVEGTRVGIFRRKERGGRAGFTAVMRTRKACGKRTSVDKRKEGTTQVCKFSPGPQIREEDDCLLLFNPTHILTQPDIFCKQKQCSTRLRCCVQVNTPITISLKILDVNIHSHLLAYFHFHFTSVFPRPNGMLISDLSIPMLRSQFGLLFH